MDDYIGFGGAFLFASLAVVVAFRQPARDPKRRVYFAMSALLANYGLFTMLHGRALTFKLVILLPLALFALIWTLRAVREVRAQNVSRPR